MWDEEPKVISEATAEGILNELEGYFEANIVPNVTVNVGRRNAELALTYLQGVQDALSLVLGKSELHMLELRGLGERIRQIRIRIKKEVR